MEIEEFKNGVEETLAKLGNENLDSLHMILGIFTEAGELADAFKKFFAYDKEIDWTNVEEELGDLMFYVVGFCNINGFELEDIFQKNYNKLHTRYKNGFNKEEANNRNLDRERKVLEGNTQLSFLTDDELVELTGE